MVHALVVAAAPPDPSGADRSLLGLDLPLEVSRDRLGTALKAAGLQAGLVILRRDPGAAAARRRAADPCQPALGEIEALARHVTARDGTAG